jgi:excinuclease ABC subunit B
MYADRITDSMRRAIDETNRRRAKQNAHNKKHGITPKTVEKQVRELIKLTKVDDETNYKDFSVQNIKKQPQTALAKMAKELEKKMSAAAKELDFEKAAEYRDRLIIVKGELGQKLTSKNNRRK